MSREVRVEDLAAALASDGLHVVGRLTDASNVAFFGWAGPVPVIYKPVRGERPLWDFPTGCLAHRERASFLVDVAAGFSVVPPTVLHDGPFGPGSVQWWVTDPDDLLPTEADEIADGTGEDEDVEDEDVEDVDLAEGDPLFLLLPPEAVSAPWLPVFSGELPDGRPVVLVHADSGELRSVSVLDAVLNNSDRKGSHLLRAPDGHLWGIDHGVTLHEDPKLRTVLWGWAGESIPDADLHRLDRLARQLSAGAELRRRLEDLLTPGEVDALVARTTSLLETGTHPVPRPGWPTVPWPAL